MGHPNEIAPMSYAMMVNAALGLVFLVLLAAVLFHARRQRRRDNALLGYYDARLNSKGGTAPDVDEHRVANGLTLTDHHKRLNRDMFSR